VSAFVTGRVQGVSFRHFTAQEGRRLGICGWVRNLADGRVELLAEGPPSAVAALLQSVGRGPPAARVDHLEVRDLPATALATASALEPFTIRR
jgi:acylphosphatase